MTQLGAGGLEATDSELEVVSQAGRFTGATIESIPTGTVFRNLSKSVALRPSKLLKSANPELLRLENAMVRAISGKSQSEIDALSGELAKTIKGIITSNLQRETGQSWGWVDDNKSPEYLADKYINQWRDAQTKENNNSRCYR